MYHVVQMHIAAIHVYMYMYVRSKYLYMCIYLIVDNIRSVLIWCPGEAPCPTFFTIQLKSGSIRLE